MWSVILSSAAAQGAAPEPNIDPGCAEVAAAGAPADYDEQAQTDFLANYYALATTLSPMHAPIPHEGGHGALGVDLSLAPSPGCARRFVQEHTTTIDTNDSPILPRIRATYAFPRVGILRPYAGLAYLPPVPVGTRSTVVLGGELGAGIAVEQFQFGARFHASMFKTVGETWLPFLSDAPTVDDLFVASTLGVDLSMGVRVESFVPYLSVGWTDVSTYFYPGDEDAVLNNLHPYFGPVASLGADGIVLERLRVGGEFYAAPGGYSLPNPNVASLDSVTRYGHLYTVRVRVGVEL
jgi:hypothetical protein